MHASAVLGVPLRPDQLFRIGTGADYHCPDCDHTPPLGSLFCNNCGAQAEELVYRKEMLKPNAEVARGHTENTNYVSVQSALDYSSWNSTDEDINVFRASVNANDSNDVRIVVGVGANVYTYGLGAQVLVDFAQIREQVKAQLERFGLWDEAAFGLYVLLSR